MALWARRGGPGHIPDGVDPGGRGFHAGVHLDEAPFVHLDPGLFQAEPFRAGPAAHRHQDFVHHDLLLAASLGGLEEHVEAILLLLVTHRLGARAYLKAFLLQGLAQEGGGFPVACGEDLRHVFDQGHLRAQAVVDLAKLEPHRPTADHQKALGDALFHP